LKNKKASCSSIASYGGGLKPTELPKGIHVKRKRSNDIFLGWRQGAERLLVTASQGVFG